MTSIQAPALERLLTAQELSAVFRVDPGTICRWAREGLLASVLTPGGRLRRFRASDVLPLLGSSVVNG